MAGAGYTTFTDGQVLTANQVNTYLMEQAVMNFANSTARTSALTTPSEGMVTYLRDTNKVEFYDGSAWNNLGGAGKVQQVQSTTYSTEVTVSSTTMTDTGLSLAITPTATTSKILVLATQQVFAERLTNTASLGMRLLRGTTEIWSGAGASGTSSMRFAIDSSSTCSINGYITAVYLDSPSTTSSTTYKTQIRAGSTANSGLARAQWDSSTSTITLIEIGA